MIGSEVDPWIGAGLHRVKAVSVIQVEVAFSKHAANALLSRLGEVDSKIKRGLAAGVASRLVNNSFFSLDDFVSITVLFLSIFLVQKITSHLNLEIAAYVL